MSCCRHGQTPGEVGVAVGVAVGAAVGFAVGVAVGAAVAGHVPQTGAKQVEQKLEGAEGIHLTHHPERSPLKAFAPKNMEFMLVTLLVSQPERSPLKAAAPLNMPLWETALFFMQDFYLLRAANGQPGRLPQNYKFALRH